VGTIGSAGNVAAIGAADVDDDGRDDLLVVRDLGTGKQALTVSALPTTKNETLAVANLGFEELIAGGERVISITGLDYDGDGDDELAALVAGLTSAALVVFATPTGLEASAMVVARSAPLGLPFGFAPTAICRVRDPTDIGDEIGLLLTHGNGAGRFVVHEPPAGFGQALGQSLFEDFAFDPPGDDEQSVAPLMLRGYAFDAPATNISGSWSATLQHLADNSPETITLDHSIQAQQAGSVLSLNFPLFHPAQAIYQHALRKLEFTTQPIEFNAPGSGTLYALSLAPGIVFAGVDRTYALGAYTGAKKLPFGQTAAVTSGVYWIEIDAP
jgi:hypothetical protein